MTIDAADCDNEDGTTIDTTRHPAEYSPDEGAEEGKFTADGAYYNADALDAAMARLGVTCFSEEVAEAAAEIYAKAARNDGEGPFPAADARGAAGEAGDRLPRSSTGGPK